jgi:hypothetical protein
MFYFYILVFTQVLTLDTLIPAHLEEFGKIGLRFAQVYPNNHEELRVVFHIVRVQ